MTGFYVKAEYQVTARDIENLEYNLKQWIKHSTEEKLEEMKRHKNMFIVPYASLAETPPNTMRSILKNFKWEYFILRLDRDIPEKDIEE